MIPGDLIHGANFLEPAFCASAVVVKSGKVSRTLSVNAISAGVPWRNEGAARYAYVSTHGAAFAISAPIAV